MFITPQEVAIAVTTIVAIATLYLFFQFTRTGMAMRATAQNRRGAALMGVNVPQIFTLAWVIGTVLAGIGGILLGPLLLVDPDMGHIGIKSFTAIVLGGFGSIPGAILGGLVLGVIENLVAVYLRPEFQAAATFVLLIVVLAFRPSGLFGVAAVRRV
jgi:branched-chain amino acid transport system permease protein